MALVQRNNSQTDSKLNLWICGVYVLCALIRLGYFNVDEEERQEKSDEGRKYYKGMPGCVQVCQPDERYLFAMNSMSLQTSGEGYVGILFLLTLRQFHITVSSISISSADPRADLFL